VRIEDHGLIGDLQSAALVAKAEQPTGPAAA
jgi:hypothetical protein